MGCLRIIPAFVQKVGQGNNAKFRLVLMNVHLMVFVNPEFANVREGIGGWIVRLDTYFMANSWAIS